MKSGASEAAVGVMRVCTRRRRRNSKNSNTVTVDLPHDLLLNILSRIPVRSLLRFKCVSRSWYNLLTHDPYFIRMHLDRSVETRRYSSVFQFAKHTYALPLDTENPEEVRAYKLDTRFLIKSEPENIFNYDRIHGGSCNGLFLISRGFPENILYLWNPGTREYKGLPVGVTQFPKLHGLSNSSLFGLGYDSTKNDYKVFCGSFYYRVPDIGYYEYNYAHVYSLRTNSVKRIHRHPLVIQKQCTDSGISLKDSILWLFQILGGMFQIVSFDFAKEDYKQVPMPDITRNTAAIQSLEIGVLKDCLCLYHLDKERNLNVIMMKDYGAKESWTSLFTIRFGRRVCWNFRALIFNNSEEVIMQIGPYPDSGHLFVCKPDERRTWIVPIHDLLNLPHLLPYTFKIKPYVENLVSLEPRMFYNTGN